MLKAFGVLLLAFVLTGITVTGVSAANEDVPMQKAIDRHKEMLGGDSTMPTQSRFGLQTSLDHLQRSQERWQAADHSQEGQLLIRQLGEFGVL